MKALLHRLISISVLFFTLVQLVTSVQAQTPATQTLRISPDNAAQSGAPGSTVTFNIALSASINENFLVNATGSAWTVNASPNPVDLSTSLDGSVQVTVAIPESGKSGDTNNFTVTFTGTKTGSSFPVGLSVTVVQPSSARPVVVIDSYYLDEDTVTPGESFRLFLSLKNTGALDAHNLILNFSGEDLTPEENGGVVSVGLMSSGTGRDMSQKLKAGSGLWSKTAASVSVKATYTNPAGETFTESFTVSVPIVGWSGTWATVTPTPTGTAMPRAQIVVSGYKADVDPLQPGSMFSLQFDVHNLGDGDARAVSMVLGGGAVPSVSETPSPGGGVSGGGADLTVFAPLGSSNVQFLGDMPVGAFTQTTQKLIVNVTANPGAYSLKLSFVYTDAKGNRQVDDQVITLLIYQMPQVEVNYYRDPGMLSAMQPNTLPIQVVNLGRKPIVMGNMTVTAEGAELMNNTSLVGTLDAGGYFPLDVMFIPQAPGSVDLKIKINYTDDFNQPRTIEQTMKVEVMEGAPMEPGMGDPGMTPGAEGMPGGMPGEMPGDMTGGMPAVEETFWDKALRFVKGLIGLDSAPPEAAPGLMPGEEMMPGEEGGGMDSAPVLPRGKG